MPRVSLDWLQVIMLLGAVQGLLLSAVLASQRYNQTANRLLAAAILAFTIYLASGVYYSAGLVRVWPHFLGVSYPLLFLFGPLIYLYARTASNRNRGLTRADGLHFVPSTVVILLGSPIYLRTGVEKIAMFNGMARDIRPGMVRWTDPLMLLSGVSYATATLVLLARHSQRVKDSYSHIERVNLRWLLWLGICAAAIWLLAAVFHLLSSIGGIAVKRGDDIVALAVAVLVYAIGYLGLRQPEVFQYAASDAVASDADLASDARAEPRYERSGLSDWEATSLEQKLLDAMETRRPWQNCELTLADLASLLGTTPHKLSEVLNSHIGQTFYDFVNGYRVREVQERLVREGANAPKLLALAMDAGFASKSTFNEVFKKHTGRTPSAYRSSATSAATSA